MSDNRLANVRQLVSLQKLDFEKLAKVHNAVNFMEEASFAMQMIQDSDYLLKTALSDQESFKRAILNVAIIGLSLNPYKGEAYLIPRKGKICLDISYRGYVNFFLNIGAIVWCVAQAHYEKDEFKWKGFNQQPHHDFDPSEERGKLKGCYVCAKLSNGDILSTYMKAKDIFHIRDTYSESWKKNRSYSPWFTNETEMCMKTVIRYARKSWPMAARKQAKQDHLRLVKMDELADNVEPIPLNSGLSEKEQVERKDILLKIRTGLEILGIKEKERIKICRRAFNHPDLKKLEDLTVIELKNTLHMINEEVDEKNKGDS
jgi:recombination protein RecT